MARSSYIYAVQHPADNRVLAAFTVKHECAEWLTRMDALTPIDRWSVVRIRDGGWEPPMPEEHLHQVTAREFVRGS